MNEMELEDLIQQSLNTFYQERSKKLYGLKLRDIFRSKNPYFIRAIVTRAASKVVDRLLEMYVSSNEDIFTQAQWEELAEYPNFYQKLTFLMNNYTVMQHRIEFEQELANAHNRFLHDFLNNFGNPDGSIDWEKLIRFNSGKENLPWVSKVAPVTIADAQEEDGSDDEE